MTIEDDFGELYADVAIDIHTDAIQHTQYEERNHEQQKNEEEDKSPVSENGSDSEDDLHILLNDEDCKPLSLLCEEEGEDNKDRLQQQQQQVAVHQSLDHISSAAAAAKSTYHSQYSQYKYIRPNGSAASANQSLASFPTTAALGSDFSLPRHRTILDVNIDAFELKPWNHPGVDITDFFNFGLDEETWKRYCNTLELYRQQTYMRNKTNQVYGPEFEFQTVATENFCGQEGGVPCILSDAIKDERRLDMPKGRAIQVDGGVGERWPSMDIRRPQIRDSDVVIQISVHDDMKCSSSSSEEELGHSENSVLNTSKDEHSDMDVTPKTSSAERTDERTCGSLSLKRCSRRKIASSPLYVESEDGSDNCDLLDVKKRACIKDSKNMEAIKDAKEKLPTPPFEEDLCMVEALHGVLNHASKMSFSDSHNEASTDEDAPVKERLHKHARKQLSSSASGLLAPATLRCDISKESESKKNNTEQRNDNDEVKNQSHMRREHCNRARLRGVADSKNVGDDEAIPMLTRNNWDGGNHLTKKSRKKRERECENGYHDGKDLPYYKETELLYGYKKERFVGKPDAYTESFNCKGRKQYKNEMDPPLRRNWSERVFMHREDEARRREPFHPERLCSNKKLNDATRAEYIHFTPEHSSVYIKEKYHWKRTERDEENCYRRGRQDDDFVLEHRYREQYIQENFLRSLPNHDREREYINENYSKHASYGSPDRRDRYSGSPCMDILPDSSWDVLQDDEYWRRPDHESQSTHSELHFTYGRRWRDAASPIHALYYSRKSKKGGMGLWRQTDHEKHQKGVRFDSTWEHRHDAHNVPFSDDYFSDAERIYPRQCKTLNWSEDRIASRQQSQGKLFSEKAPFSYERSLRHRSVHIKKYDSSHCGMIFDENCFVHAGNRKIRQGIRDSVINPPLVDKDTDAQVAPRHKTSVDLQFIGWEGKASKCGDKKKAQSGKCELADIGTKTEKVKEDGNTYDSQRILETLAKMEKRRKRFDQPAVKEAEKPQPLPEATVVEQVEQQRPARKRRWGGS
ncbi:hypothetical protein ACHQM5_025744 [Ranunculus cassubicifolius]